MYVNTTGIWVGRPGAVEYLDSLVKDFLTKTTGDEQNIILDRAREFRDRNATNDELMMSSLYYIKLFVSFLILLHLQPHLQLQDYNSVSIFGNILLMSANINTIRLFSSSLHNSWYLLFVTKKIKSDGICRLFKSFNFTTHSNPDETEENLKLLF